MATVTTQTGKITASFTGAVQRTLASKLEESVSVEDFGAVGDGTTDDAAAFNAAIAALGSVYVPPGTYRLASAIEFGSNGVDRYLHGAGPGVTTLAPDDGVDAISATGAWARVGISGMSIRTAGTAGARTAGRGIYLNPSNQSFNAVLRDLMIDTAGSAIVSKNAFTFKIEDVEASSDNDHVFDIEGGNATVLDTLYARDVRASAKAGFRIHGPAMLRNCNGVNTGDYWLIAGDTIGADAILGVADGRTNPCVVILENCNIEDFAKTGIYVKGTVRNLSLNGVTFLAPPTGTFDTYIRTGSASESVGRGISIFGGTALSKGATRNASASIVIGGAMPVIPIGTDDWTTARRDDQSLNYALDVLTVDNPRYATFGFGMNNLSVKETLTFLARTAEPSPSADGTTLRADGTNLDPGSGGGVYTLDNSVQIPMWAHKLNLATAFATDTTATALQCDGRRFTNTGAAGTVTVTLPEATVGRHLFAVRLASQTFRLDPNTTQIIGTGGAGKYIELGSDNAVAELICLVTGIWTVRSQSGTISYEP